MLYIQKNGSGRAVASFRAFFEAFFSAFVYRGMCLLPTYTDGRLAKTVKKSVALLGEGTSLMIFPENSEDGYKAEPTDFFPGFVLVAKGYGKTYGSDIPMRPVYYHKKKRLIVVGEACSLADFGAAKKDEVAEIMRGKVIELYRRIESGESDRKNKIFCSICKKKGAPGAVLPPAPLSRFRIKSSLLKFQPHLMPHRPAVNRGAHALVNKAEFCIKGHKARLAGEHNAKAALPFCKLGKTVNQRRGISSAAELRQHAQPEYHLPAAVFVVHGYIFEHRVRKVALFCRCAVDVCGKFATLMQQQKVVRIGVQPFAYSFSICALGAVETLRLGGGKNIQIVGAAKSYLHG